MIYLHICWWKLKQWVQTDVMSLPTAVHQLTLSNTPHWFICYWWCVCAAHTWLMCVLLMFKTAIFPWLISSLFETPDCSRACHTEFCCCCLACCQFPVYLFCCRSWDQPTRCTLWSETWKRWVCVWVFKSDWWCDETNMLISHQFWCQFPC